MNANYQIIQGDCIERLKDLPSESVHCCVTSPPYFGLRDYGTAEWDGGDPECDHKGRPYASPKSTLRKDGRAHSSLYETEKKVTNGQPYREKCSDCGAVRIDQQIGLEPTPAEFVATMVTVFEEVRRVLRSDGVCFMNLGDSYATGTSSDRKPTTTKGDKVPASWSNRSQPTRHHVDEFKPKDLMLIPHRVAIALQDAGWYVRSDMPWLKRSAMPESVTDRPAKALEYVFMLTKSEKYFADMEAVRVKMAESSFARMERGVSENDKNITGAPGQTPHSMNKPRPNKRDRSLPNNRNGENGNLDATPAGGRNFRNSDLWFSSLREPHGLVSIGDELVGLDVNPSGFKDAHFATFPPKLIEPLIKMGTSEKGCCVDCGAPWERITETEYGNPGNRSTNGPRSIDNRDFTAGFEQRLEKVTSTTGWKKTCRCETDEVKPCTVLDPFAGAGTTLLVSKRLGRNSIGIELNPEYIKMIEHRLAHWHKSAPPPVVKVDTAAEMPLFMEIGA